MSIPVFDPASRIDEFVKALRYRGFDARIFETAQDASDAIMAEISASETVGIGGSTTVKQLGVYDRLISRGNTVFWHWTADYDCRRDAAASDVYLCSVNAATAEGDLVDIDGFGNRSGSMVYGPRRCIITMGLNKLCPDLTSAIERIKTVACPQNARRLKMDVPCAQTNRCFDCAPDKRMCRVTTIYSYPLPGRDTKVFVVKEKLGF